MKKLIAILLLAPSMVLAQAIFVPVATVVEWDDINPDGTVSEYRMYCTPSTPVIRDIGNRVASIAYPTKQWSITLPVGDYACAVSAVNINGVLESGLSNELEFTVFDFSAPTNFRVVTP